MHPPDGKHYIYFTVLFHLCIHLMANITFTLQYCSIFASTWWQTLHLLYSTVPALPPPDGKHYIYFTVLFHLCLHLVANITFTLQYCSIFASTWWQTLHLLYSTVPSLPPPGGKHYIYFTVLFHLCLHLVANITFTLQYCSIFACTWWQTLHLLYSTVPSLPPPDGKHYIYFTVLFHLCIHLTANITFSLQYCSIFAST